MHLFDSLFKFTEDLYDLYNSVLSNNNKHMVIVDYGIKINANFDNEI
jgi:hypothetical protein